MVLVAGEIRQRILTYYQTTPSGAGAFDPNTSASFFSFSYSQV